jgi:hypothetical protein
MCISPEAGSEINLQITLPIRSSPVEEWFDINVYKSGVEQGIELESEPEPESEPQPESEPTIIVARSGAPVIQRAYESTVKARARMVQKYSKRHDIQHFEIKDIVSLKVPREDRTSTDNRYLFGRILNELYPYRYKGCNIVRKS